MADPQQQAALEKLADQLSACANALHQRLMRDLRRPVPDGGAPAISQGVAQALFEDEVALRQRANHLYLDAAVLAAAGLAAQQQLLLDVTAQAQQKIDRIDRVKELVDLAAELVALGAAVAAGKPEKVLPALEKLKQHVAAL